MKNTKKIFTMLGSVLILSIFVSSMGVFAIEPAKITNSLYYMEKYSISIVDTEQFTKEETLELIEYRLNSSNENVESFWSRHVGEELTADIQGEAINVHGSKTIRDARSTTYTRIDTYDTQLSNKGKQSIFTLSATFRESQKAGVGIYYEVLNYSTKESATYPWGASQGPSTKYGYKHIALNADTASTIGVGVEWVFKVNGDWFNTTLYVCS